jgi:hypothetical protein
MLPPEQAREYRGVMRRKMLSALQDLLTRGIVMHTGQYRNGQMVYKLTPDAELSNENRAYLTYLKSLRRDAQVN